MGAYSYSEGLETLCDRQVISDPITLIHWLEQELKYGSIRVETAVLVRAYDAINPVSFAPNLETLKYWNNWFSASRETAELRASSWQMGTSLGKLLADISPSDFTQTFKNIYDASYPVGVCNLAIAFGIAAATWKIDKNIIVSAYLQTWVGNLVSAGVKLIPLGQTAGQTIIFNLGTQIAQTALEVLNLRDDQLESCNWGLALASMQHEYLYSRLFRS
nr:urease accessory protein UreF [Synechococcus sp. PCC 7502]